MGSGVSVEELPLAAPEPGFGFVFVFLALLVVAAFYVQKRFGSSAASGRGSSLRLVSRLALGEKRAIVIVEAQGERLLIGVTAQSVSLLSRLREGSSADAPSAPDPIGSPGPSVENSFLPFLKRAILRKARS